MEKRRISELLQLTLLFIVAGITIYFGYAQKKVANAPQDLLPELKHHLSSARSYHDTASLENPSIIYDRNREIIGYYLDSTPYGQSITGYAGPIPCLIIMDKNHQILGISLLDNLETPNYIEYITDELFLKNWNGLTPEEAKDLNVDTISGATFSSQAIIDTVHHCLNNLKPGVKKKSYASPTYRNLILGTLLLLSGLCCYFHWIKSSFYYTMHRIFTVGAGGFILGYMLSLEYFYQILTSFQSSFFLHPVFGILLITIILAILFRRNIYCNWLCPYGMLQILLTKIPTPKQKLPKTMSKFLLWLPLIYIFLIILLTCKLAIPFTYFEPFTAFGLRTSAKAPMILAVAGLFLSLFIPRCWCRFFCPTGLILRLISRLRKKG